MIAMEAEVRPPVVQETVATERENGSVLDLSEINAVREGYELVGWMVTFDGQDVYLTKRTAEVVDYADGFAPNAETDDVEEDSEKPTETTEPDDEEISDDEVFPETEAYGTETEAYDEAEDEAVALGFDPSSVVLSPEEIEAISANFVSEEIPYENPIETTEVEYNCLPDDVVVIDADASIVAVWTLAEDSIERAEEDAERIREERQAELDAETDEAKDKALATALEEKIERERDAFLTSVIAEKETEEPTVETEVPEEIFEEESESESEIPETEVPEVETEETEAQGSDGIEFFEGDVMPPLETEATETEFSGDEAYDPNDVMFVDGEGDGTIPDAIPVDGEDVPETTDSAGSGIVFDDLDRLNELSYGDLYYRNYEFGDEENEFVLTTAIPTGEWYAEIPYVDGELVDLSELTEMRKGYAVEAWEISYPSRNGGVSYDEIDGSAFFSGDAPIGEHARMIATEGGIQDYELAEIANRFSYDERIDDDEFLTTFRFPADAYVEARKGMRIRPIWTPIENKTIDLMEKGETKGLPTVGRTEWDSRLESALAEEIGIRAESAEWNVEEGEIVDEWIDDENSGFDETILDEEIVPEIQDVPEETLPEEIPVE